MLEQNVIAPIVHSKLVEFLNANQFSIVSFINQDDFCSLENSTVMLACKSNSRTFDLLNGTNIEVTNRCSVIANYSFDAALITVRSYIEFVNPTNCRLENNSYNAHLAVLELDDLDSVLSEISATLDNI